MQSTLAIDHQGLQRHSITIHATHDYNHKCPRGQCNYDPYRQSLSSPLLLNLKSRPHPLNPHIFISLPLLHLHLFLLLLLLGLPLRLVLSPMPSPSRTSQAPLGLPRIPIRGRPCPNKPSTCCISVARSLSEWSVLEIALRGMDGPMRGWVPRGLIRSDKASVPLKLFDDTNTKRK